jgi:hypothetical protein
MEDGFSFHVVPEAGLEPALRAALQACDGVTFDSVGTVDEAPERWRDCMLVMLATGARDVGYFERQLERAPAGLAPAREYLEALTGAWEPGWVECEGGVIDASKLDTRLVRVAYVFDRL